MAEFKCSLCIFETSKFEDVIFHAIHTHAHREICIFKRNGDRKAYKRLTFPVVPEVEHKKGKIVLTNNEKQTINVVDLDEHLLLPANKSKTDSKNKDENQEPQKTIETCSQTEDINEDVVSIDTKNLGKIEKQFLIDILPFIPMALQYLHENNQLAVWFILFKCLANRTFPMDNIAYNLFLDVVNWFSCDDACGMRFSDTVERFWRTGKQLFKGKFLRFMSGFKHLGQVLSHETNLGHYDTSLSKINFIVPSRAILDTDDSCLKSSCKTPGIMIPLIENIATKQKHIHMPFKLSIDLKKLNPGGKFGDVNCFGFENTPTFDQRQARLQKEFQWIKSFQTAVEQNSKPSSCIQGIVKCLGLRQKDLKTLRKKRQYALDKIKQEAGDRWRDSKYAFILSSLQTSLYEVRRTITAIQSTTKSLLQIGAYFSGFAYPTLSSVDLSEQPNYKCLIGMDKEMQKKYNIPTKVYCQFVKQRSEEWFNIRSGAMVTGSTVYSAIGLDSLKAEQRHYDEVVRGKPKEIPSDEVQKRMDHGTRNEINAIATLVSVVLPTFYSAMTFHEEGCYIIDNQGEKFCVVSPDGSLRMNARPVIAVEIKCPSPQNFNSEEPYYRVPVRYVLQMMMETFVLKVSTAILVCWMPKTTTLLDVPFSQAIWEKMWKIIINIYSPEGLKRPTSLHSDLKDLKADLHEFVELQCKFLCEVPSYVGNECHHENMELNNADDLFITHQSNKSPFETSATEIMSILSDCEKHVYASHSLCRDIAKQVFVVMLSDVDCLSQKYPMPV